MFALSKPMPFQEEKQKELLAKVRQEEEENRAKILAEKTGFSYLNLSFAPIEDDALALIDKKQSENAKVAVIGRESKILSLAATNPDSKETQTIIAELQKNGYSVKIFVVSQTSFQKALLHYPSPREAKEIAGQVEISKQNLSRFQEEITGVESFRTVTEKLFESRATEIVELGFHENTDLETLLDEAEQKLFSVSQKYLKQNFVALSEVLHETFDRLDELHREKGKLRGVPTGFSDLDNKLAGLQKSDLIILAARPSMGKTSLALDIIRHVAMVEKKAVGIFSLEMSKDQLVDRLLAAEANVDLWLMRTGKLNDLGPDNDFERIGHALGRLSEAQIFIDDSGSLNIMELRTKARRLQAEHDLDLIVVDYLQLMQGRSPENRVQEVSEISRSLKILAKELNVPVLALSQLSRAVEQRGGDKKPQLSDLRESGSIEQDADVVMFIYRDEMYNGKDSKKPHIADILIRKHRNGPTGDIELFFDAEKTSFKNLAKQPPSVEETMMEQIME